MFTILFLGNPGKEYTVTRHNAGRIVGEAVAKKFKIILEENTRMKSLVGEGLIGESKVRLMLPDTFMNKSGDAIKNIPVNAKKVIIVHDDADLMTGKLKFSFGKRDGGHKGVASVLRVLKTRDIWRIRVGIQKKNRIAAEEMVLRKFSPVERLVLNKLGKVVCEALPVGLDEGFEKAASLYTV